MARQRKKKGRSISGWVILDKPVGMGSTQCVSKIKWLFQAAKAGHAGTLDPLASGMLPIALGEATKTVPYVMDGCKTYRFAVRWGAETNTDDLEGEITNSSAERPDEAAIKAILPNYTGEIEQTPPSFSAVKIDGERAYKRARAGEDVVIEPRTVSIHSFDVVEVRDDDTCLFEINCGKGTYVRALARDMGRELGCLGHICELRRTAVDPFDEEDFIKLDYLIELEGDLDGLDNQVLATGIALDELPEAVIDKQQVIRLRAGNPVLLRGRDAIIFAEEACAINGADLIAIGNVDKGSFFPKRVFKVSLA
jgi:tRNA pseudouridine55 synthase